MTRPPRTGLGYRHELVQKFQAWKRDIEIVEVITDWCFDVKTADKIRANCEGIEIVLHGLSMSLGTLEPLQESYLQKTADVVSALRPTWASDHLAMTRVAGQDLPHLFPLSRSDSVLRSIVDKIRTVKDTLACPFLVENIAYVFEVPGAQMPEWEFVSGIAELADVDLLLDLNNLYANAKNHGYDPYEFLDRIPLHRVVQLHLAGGFQDADLFIDSHAHDVGDDVWNYLRYVCERADVQGIIVERDGNFPPNDELIDEVRRARGIAQGARTQAEAVTVAPTAP